MLARKITIIIGMTLAARAYAQVGGGGGGVNGGNTGAPGGTPGGGSNLVTPTAVLCTASTGILTECGATALFKSAGIIQVGGATSSFPAFKRSGTQILVRLADDSGDASLKTLSMITSGITPGADGLNAIQFFKADGSTYLGSIDTTDSFFRWGSSNAFEVTPSGNWTSNILDAGFNRVAITAKNTAPYVWSSTTAVSGTPDTGMSRVSANAIGFGNGTQGDTTAAISAGAGTFGGGITVPNGGGNVSFGNNNTFVQTLVNPSSVNNAQIDLQTTGITMFRNIADANTAVISDQKNASSTGLIHDFQFADASVAAVNKSGIFSKYANDTTAGNGLGSIVATANATAQGANIGSTLLYTTTATSGGLYEAVCTTIITTADGVSSTLPQCNFIYTDPDTNAASTVTAVATSAGNVIGQLGPIGTRIYLNAKASTAINYSTTGYLSNTASQMKYAVHVALIRIGN